MLKPVLFVAVLLACAHAASHIPMDSRSFITLTPREAAEELRHCFDKWKVRLNISTFNKRGGGWAGWVLHDEELAPGIIAGPLIPKSMSSSLRQMYGNRNRPKGLMTVEQVLDLSTHNESRRNFWFAVVRDPLTRFIDAYVEAGNGQPHFLLPGTATLCNFTKAHSAAHFCEQPLQCRKQHFENWVMDHHLDPNGRVHRAPQLDWLTFAVPYLDAVLRLENLEMDWLFATQYTAGMANSTINDFDLSSEWFLKHAMHGGKKTNAKRTKLDDGADACQQWRERGEVSSRGAYYQVLQDNALQWSTAEVLRIMCEALALDYACLRYAMPAECQLG